MLFRDRLVCFEVFIRLTMPAVFLPLPLPNCFLKVCLPTLFAAVLKFFLPQTTSAISGAVNSNKSAPTCFAAGTIHRRKNGIGVPPKNCVKAPNPRPRCRPIPPNSGTSLFLSNHLVTFLRLKMFFGGSSEHQNKTSDTDRYKKYIFVARVCQVNVNTMKRFFEQRSELQDAKCLIVHVRSSSYNFSSLGLWNKN